jgi:hypothetical protein
MLTMKPTVADTFPVDHTYFGAIAGTSTYQLGIATIGGRAKEVSLGELIPLVILPAVDYATSHRLDIIAQQVDASGKAHVSALRTVFGDAPAARAMVIDPYMVASTMKRLPDGRLLVATATNQGYSTPGSLLCSSDDGMTWATTC